MPGGVLREIAACGLAFAKPQAAFAGRLGSVSRSRGRYNPGMAETLSGIIERVTFHNPETGFAVLRVQAARPARPRHRRRHAAARRRRRVHRGRRRAGSQDRAPRPAVQGRRAAHHAAAHRRGHREVPRLRPRQGHRPALRPQDRRGLRRADAGGHRREPVVPHGGQGHRPAAASSASARAGSEQKAVRDIMVFLQSHGIGTAGPSASTRPTATRPSSWCGPTRTGWRPTSGASASRRPTSWPSGSASTARLAAAGPGRRCATSCRSCSQRGPRRLPRGRRRRARPRELTEHRRATIVARRGRGRARRRARSSASRAADEPWLYLKPLFLAELGVARALRQLQRGRRTRCRRSTSTPALGWVEQKMGLELAADAARRRRARRRAQKVLVITGGPGTGKTTIVRGILEIFAAEGAARARCAPRPAGPPSG